MLRWPAPHRCALFAISLSLSRVGLVGGARLETGDGIDWRKAAGLGMLGGTATDLEAGALPWRSKVPGPLRDDGVRRSQGGGQQGQNIREESAVAGEVSQLRGGGLFDWDQKRTAEVPLEQALEKLLPSIRQRRLWNGLKLTRSLERDLDAQRLERIEGPQAGEKGVEYYALLSETGERSAVLIRYPADESRGSGQVRALQNMLRSSQKVRYSGFLRVYARSHSPSCLDEHGTSEVLLLVEPFVGTLRQYLEQPGMNLRSRINAVLWILMYSVHDLEWRGIAHTSDITLDTVLVTGDLEDSFRNHRGRAVLGPSIFDTDVRVEGFENYLKRRLSLKGVPSNFTSSAELLKNDIRMCGALLVEVLDAPCLQTVQDELSIKLVRNFADAMQLGSFDDVAADRLLDRLNRKSHFGMTLLHHVERQSDYRWVPSQEVVPSTL